MDDQRPAPPQTPDHAPPQVSLATIFWIFFQIGSLSFGGGLSAWLYREVVEKRKLMTGTDFIGALTLAQVLPGINMTNLSVYVGQRLRGVSGAFTAMFGLLLVPFFAIVGIGTIYARIKDIPIIHDFLDGVAAVAVGLLLSMAWKSIQVTGMRREHLVVMALVAVAVGIFRWSMIPVILVMAPISVLLAWNVDRKSGEKAAEGGPDA